jgi:hypothetical protein
MMTRIISSANPGVEMAALDVARKIGVDYGGWLSKRKPPQNDEIVSIYQLKETPFGGNKSALEKNTLASDGVLIISRGEKNERLQRSVAMALKHQRQFLGIDLKQYSLFEAASLINSWTDMQKVKAAFVTGALESEVPGIYSDAHRVLETAFYLGFVKSDAYTISKRSTLSTTNTSAAAIPLPRTIDECVRRLMDALSLKERTLIANMQADELSKLRSGIGEFVLNRFGLYGGNEPLMKSCADMGKINMPLAEEACAIILRALWEELSRTHKLRVIR